MFLISGGISALISFYLNKFFVKIKGNKAIYLLIPIVEEGSKNFAAYFLSANILFTHIIFGLVEAVYDWLNSAKSVASTAAIMSIVTHSVLGFIAHYSFDITGNILVATLLSWIAHFAWNYFVVKN